MDVRYWHDSDHDLGFRALGLSLNISVHSQCIANFGDLAEKLVIRLEFSRDTS